MILKFQSIDFEILIYFSNKAEKLLIHGINFALLIYTGVGLGKGVGV